MRRRELAAWLAQEDKTRLEELWRRADDVRRRFVGDEVHLRGLVEFSNHCGRGCAYCGLRAGNHGVRRYRMSAAEILACAGEAVRRGYGTLVLQSGEDEGCDAAWLGGVIRRIKAETPLAVTLGVGERDDAEFALWREAGADRYLLRFETSNPELFRRLHPPRPGRVSDRVGLLRRLRALGYEIGSGVMVGLPGQRRDDLVADLELCRELDLDMIGIGPYIVHPATPLARVAPDADPAAVPATAVMALKVVALARLVCPRANIPSTTAIATVDRAHGRARGLARGANVVMPCLTPPAYRALYDIYPEKAHAPESAAAIAAHLAGPLARRGRRAGTGRGDAPAHRARGERRPNPW